jgi:hypothetical protein
VTAYAILFGVDALDFQRHLEHPMLDLAEYVVNPLNPFWRAKHRKGRS